jgi:acyl-CoA oxidase
MTGSDIYKLSLAMANRLHQLKETHRWTPHQADLARSLIDAPTPIGIHAVAFEPVFFTQACPSLIQKYGDLVKNWGILGCYLQTELAHGSNLASLETTATYLPHSQEFEIHTPSFTAANWWIGALGKTSTHGLVQAKLILPGGKDMGPHLFFIQLRSLGIVQHS